MTCIPLNTNLLHIIYMDVDTLMLSFLFLFFFLVNYNSDYNVINIETHLTPIVMVKIWGLLTMKPEYYLPSGGSIPH